MDDLLFLMAGGARQIMEAQTINSNNMANASTTGFQADLANFKAESLWGEGLDSRVYSVTEGAGVSFDKGMTQSTGRDLDIAINGDGWIAVQAPDGTEAYTRAGNMSISINGQLLTGAGHPVLGDNGPILIPETQKIEIGTDGTISVVPIGQSPSTLAEVGRIRVVSPPHESMYKGEDGLIRVVEGVEVEASTGATVVSGALESSNVNAIDAMVNMISLARSFELSVKMMKTAEEMDQSSTKILNLG